MKVIPLPCGRWALVDDEDFARFRRYRWHVSAGRYVARCLTLKDDGRSEGVEYLHRAITGAARGSYVDHRNHDTLDNRRMNLRICTHQQNLQNRAGLPSNSTTGRLGVTWDRARGKYVAQVHILGKHLFLGRYDTLDEADRAAKEGRSRVMVNAAAWMLPERNEHDRAS